MGDYETLEVNGKTYYVQPLSPLEAVDWAAETTAVVGPMIGSLTSEKGVRESIATALSNFNDKQAAGLLKKALARCVTPENKPLSNDAVFAEWFGRTENKGDLLFLGGQAAYVLVRDFFPLDVVTKLLDSQVATQKQ